MQSIKNATRILTLVKLKSLSKFIAGYVRSLPYRTSSTMTVDSQPFCAPAKHPPDPHLDDDETTIATPPKGRKQNRNDLGMTSKVIKFRFMPPNTQKQQVAPSLIHTHWMYAVQEAIGEDVEIINNRNQKVEPINLLNWSNPLIHKKTL